MKRKLGLSFVAMCLTTSVTASLVFASIPPKQRSVFQNTWNNPYGVSDIIQGRDTLGKIGVEHTYGGSYVDAYLWERCGAPTWHEINYLSNNITNDGPSTETVHMNSSCEYKLTIEAGANNAGEGFIQNYN
ncbi:hypothetical protein YDYSY3_38980 [Paenibacillus chitinolyticus]|uniref:hypothetical protein n=1 Tax=Paenibacillus chitinolyticus TaxID=79263 RepID=UPI0026E4C1E5|nr:hypothetical protein [Paenibacillus chitinolyticus]GKS12898.1 hypothetical protein YDYSY3_38980 [Paenibacillus chitinolyticus]